MKPQEPARLAELEIRSRDTRGRGVRPAVWLGAERQPWSLSITHGDRSVAVALSIDARLGVGVDLVDLPARSEPPGTRRTTRLDLWMTSVERRWLNRQTTAWAPLWLWALKEAAYKAAHADGEPFRPLQWEVVPETARKEDAWNEPAGRPGTWFRCVGPGGRTRCQLSAVLEDGQILAVAVATTSARSARG